MGESDKRYAESQRKRADDWRAKYAHTELKYRNALTRTEARRRVALAWEMGAQEVTEPRIKLKGEWHDITPSSVAYRVADLLMGESDGGAE